MAENIDSTPAMLVGNSQKAVAEIQVTGSQMVAVETGDDMGTDK